jgi:hypothetical protein
MNTANPSKSGLDVARGFPTAKTTAPVEEGTWSGSTGEDQSARMGGVAESRPTNPGNTLPGVPPLERC